MKTDSNSFFTRFFVFLIAAVILAGCGDDEVQEEINNQGGGGTPTPTPTYFMNATINGVDYTTSNVSIFGVGNREGCLPVSYHISNVGQIDLASYMLDVNLLHYSDNSVFSLSDTGTFGVYTVNDFFWGNNSEIYCVHDLVVELYDNQNDGDASILNSGGTHTVTAITEVSQNSTDVIYAVEGTFSMSFVNLSGETVNVSGNYRIPVDARL